ncbi:outer membrane lipoprotein carrier protein LolA [Streptomyces sp. NPDC101112]|jgi:outer membrane lipoprotein-sorting protein|uniref:LolA family protein n=1 Tax=Streptomyces sp. NPDC101112 TaxID=3366105 RepID=UPI003820A174
MAPYESDDSARAGDAAVLAAEAEEVRSARRRKAARYVVPATVLGVAAATIGLVPAFAGSGDPDLPKISAQELIEKIAASDVQRVSGTVKITTDLGLPDLGGLADSLVAQGASGGDGSSADPSSKLLELATGTHTLRIATDGPDKQKLSLLDKTSEYSLIHNGDEVWAYDSASNEVYHATGAGEEGKGGKDGKGREDVPEDVPATPQQLAEEALKAVDDTTSVTVDGTAQVAGRDAYKLVIAPKQSGSTIGAISIAVDAKTGLPLKFTLTPASGGSAVVDAGFTEVDFGKPSASTFDFTPPKGAKVTEADELEKSGHHDNKVDGSGEDFGKDFEKEFGKDFEKEFGKDADLKKAGGAEEEFASGLDGLKTIGKGWSSIAVIDSGAEGGLPTGGSESSGDSRVDGFLNSLGDQVKGDFGSGTVFKTRLINVLFTDDGKVYAGAVTKDALVKAADAAK